MCKNTNVLRKVWSFVICFSLLFQQTGFAQSVAQMDLSGYLSGLKDNFAPDIYRPAHLRYFSYDNLTDNFKLLVEKGDFVKSHQFLVTKSPDKKTLETGDLATGDVNDLQLKQETNKLLKYFLTGVSLPDDMFWVNLRPDSQDQIIDSWLEKTDVGRIMLEADLQLKKDTAMFTSPETALGRKYWDKLYKKAAELYGYDNVTIPTLTRPWIVPGEIIVRETSDSAYVYKAVLKVMLEEDYLKSNFVGEGLVSSRNQNTINLYEFKDPRAKELNTYSTQLIKELIIPKLTKEINSSKRYAALRQVYYSLILSRWFKVRFGSHKTEKTGYVKLIDSRNLANLTSQQAWSKETYYKQYQKSFAEGEYNIKEPVSTPTGQVIRSYFSGGVMLGAKITVNSFVAPKGISSAVLNKKTTTLIESNAQEGVSNRINNELIGLPYETVSSGINLTDSQDLSNKILPNGIQLTVDLKYVSSFADSADGEEVTAMDLRKAGVKAILDLDTDGQLTQQEQRIAQAEAAGLMVVEFKKLPFPYSAYEAKSIKDIEQFISNAVLKGWNRGYLLIIPPDLARNVYEIGQKIQKENASVTTSISSAVDTNSIMNYEDIIPSGITRLSLPAPEKYQLCVYNLLDVIRIEVVDANKGKIKFLVKQNKKYTTIGPEGRYAENAKTAISIAKEELSINLTNTQKIITNPARLGLVLMAMGELKDREPSYKTYINKDSKGMLYRIQETIYKKLIDKEENKYLDNYIEGVNLFKIIKRLIVSSNKNETQKKTSSGIGVLPEAPGGIDFGGGAMNIRYEAAGAFKGMDLKLPDLPLAELNSINIDSEIQRVKKMVSSGISPSGDWFIKLVSACKQKGQLGRYSPDLLLCVVDTCELGEINGDESSADFKKALAVVDLLS